MIFEQIGRTAQRAEKSKIVAGRLLPGVEHVEPDNATGVCGGHTKRRSG